MDYEKKLYEQGTITESLSYVFDELAELEDERIRKNCIHFLELQKSHHAATFEIEECIAWLEKQCKQDDYDDNIITRDDEILQAISVGLTDVQKDAGWSDFGGIPIEDIMDWLEKQGQVKESEPKYNVGDWIVWKDKCYKVNDNGCGYELINQDGLSTSLEYGTVDENAHLWTIEDAKNGDVLVCENGWTCIFNCLNDNLFCSHCFMDDEGWFCKDGGQAHTLDNRICGEIYPATKEQRDLLFQKMREAGYEFDFNKKELKKTPEESLGISSEKYNEIVNKCIFGEEKKSKWSEEDDYNVQCCIAKAECDIENGCIERNKELIEWLKSLKQRLI